MRFLVYFFSLFILFGCTHDEEDAIEDNEIQAEMLVDDSAQFLPTRLKELVELSELEGTLELEDQADLHAFAYDIELNELKDLITYLEGKSSFPVLILSVHAFYRLGDNKSGDAVLAKAMVRNQEALAYFYWGWMHSSGSIPRLIDTRMLGIAYALLEMYDTFNDSEKEIARLYLYGLLDMKNKPHLDVGEIKKGLLELGEGLDLQAPFMDIDLY